MNLKEYIKFRLKKAYGVDHANQMRILMDIYDEMSKRGHSIEEIAQTVKIALQEKQEENIKEFRKTINKIKKELKKWRREQNDKS